MIRVSDTHEAIRESPKPNTPDSIGSGSGYSTEDLLDIKPEEIKTASLAKHLNGISGWQFLQKNKITTAHDKVSKTISNAKRALGGTQVDQRTQEALYDAAVENPERFKIVADFLANPKADRTATVTALGNSLKEANDTDTVNLLNSLVKDISSARNKAATKIQSLMRGHQVRKKTVFQSEVKKFLDANLKGLTTVSEEQIDHDALSKAIAREILELSTSGALNEQGVLLNTGKLYAFTNEDDLNQLKGVTQKKDKDMLALERSEKARKATQVQLPVELWVKKTPKGVEIEMVGQILGIGSDKTVSRSKTFEIDLSTEKHQKSPLENTVALEMINAGANIDLLTGIELVQQRFHKELKAGTLMVAGMVTHAGQLVEEKIEDNPDEVKLSVTGNRSKEVNGQLVTVARELEYDTGELTDNNLEAAADVAETLLKFHSKGIIHRDVKGPNIFEKKGRGFLADFGRTKEQGFTETGHVNYPYWDPLSRLGYVTPFCDAQGLTRTLSWTLFGAHDDNISEDDVRKLPLFQNPPPKLKAIRDGIAAIFDANKLTVNYLNANPNMKDLLTSENPKKIQKAIDALQEKFPAYHNFIKLVSKTRPR